MRVAFVVFAVLCLGGVFASLARGKLHGDAARLTAQTRSQKPE
jgi:hypothetical protein